MRGLNFTQILIIKTVQMTSSEKEYMAMRNQRIKKIQKIFAIVSIISFGGSTVFAVVNMIKSGEKQQLTPQVTSQQNNLEEQIKGLELVLQREPENRVALESLAKVKIQLKDEKGAIEPLEKLVSKYPERKDYKAILEEIKKK
jgi:cytochrome c-type biogenesis protein CcmH/NrfG